ncbi:MAG TPA: hypothetical protein VFZ65_05035 [Planctomycetota bacterium]|nr:hypothetical protein [Planctomycetota bacterium]
MTNTAESRWRSLIAAQARSGKSVREFAASRGINATTFYWWRSRLRRQPSDLVPVTVVAPVEGRDSMLELQVGEMTVRVPTGFVEADLRRLLQVLRC